MGLAKEIGRKRNEKKMFFLRKIGMKMDLEKMIFFFFLNEGENFKKGTVCLK